MIPPWLLPFVPGLRRFAPYIAAVVAVLLVLGIAYHRGAVSERDAIAAKAAKDKINAITEREKIERDNLGAPDSVLIDKLRRPD